MNSRDRFFAIKFGLIAGVVTSIIYPLMITTHGPGLWPLLLEISFGPMFIISSYSLYLFIKHYGNSFYNEIGWLFTILAGAAILMTNTVQKSVFSMMADMQSTDDHLVREMIRRSFKSGNLTQLGMDFYWDVLVSIGISFFALAILHQKYLPKLLTIAGLIIGIGGLFINMLTFPVPPANNELIDPGPFFAVFYGIVLLFMLHAVFIKKALSA
ncbi:hypothetical protein [Roseivirga thermotolerans]|uniref:hypothetical protein n=1 Tax=Roseivirga thermotolerans TaxID=1758176 RepID=UPI00273EC45A|nr:hypothetical protein [Roseivirga thermotolerans]